MLHQKLLKKCFNDSVLKTSPWTYRIKIYQVILLKRIKLSVDTSNLVTKKDFVSLKARTDMLDINELVNNPTSLNNLKTNVDCLDVSKSKAVPVEVEKLSDSVSKEVVKNIKFSYLNTKVNSLENTFLRQLL